MNKKVICGGICAATLVFTAAISVISCSTDDEYYAEGNYTLAKKHMTRSVEGNVVPPVIPMKISAGADTAYYDVPFIDAYGKRIVSIVSWDSGYTALTAHPCLQRFQPTWIHQAILLTSMNIKSELAECIGAGATELREK